MTDIKTIFRIRKAAWRSRVSWMKLSPCLRGASQINLLWSHWKYKAM